MAKRKKKEISSIVIIPKWSFEIKKKDKIFFRRPCERCDMMFIPSGKTVRICPNCKITPEERRKRKNNKL